MKLDSTLKGCLNLKANIEDSILNNHNAYLNMLHEIIINSIRFD